MIVAIFIFLNYISSYFFFRIDLTTENRYTLAPATTKLLKNLNDVVYVKVYLDGELPAGFKRLQNGIKEMLDEFRVYGGENIQYEFINPSENTNKKERNDFYRQLFQKGLTPTNLQEKDNDGTQSQKIIFSGALVSYKNIEAPVDFLTASVNQSPEQNLNGSIEEIEYQLISAILKLKKEFSQKIAFIYGHGELESSDVEDISNSLSEYYTVERIKISGKLNSLSERVEDSLGFRVHNKYDLIIIAKPDSAYTEQDKFIIDQHIMLGGKMLWLLDATNAEIDSLAYTSSILATLKETNLNDQLFHYGVRVNPNLVQDIQCALIPVNTAIAGTQPQFSPESWVYFPLLQPLFSHPIGRNVNLVKAQFASSIDFVGEAQNINKTVLLATSQYSREVNAPVRIGLELIREKPEPENFGKSNLPVAVLLEGKFSSVFKNRITPEISDSPQISFKSEGISTKMVVISDGDLIRNNVQKLGFKSKAQPLGLDRYTGETFGNKDFLLNVINYMLDNTGFMSLRSREIKLRLLDKSKIENSKTIWQIVNTLIPIIIIIVLGTIITIFRKRKYSSNK
ncbi:MAG: gliding motility-associated ABC transporter substrate-binding protein GldG [Bacteroidetes bacterium GWA2_32_17]|nr:MAG: gliding motility-associated ABC transporter substrate-binding protein GldG [Bacteroidetes bacterium GWA2_32_17]